MSVSFFKCLYEGTKVVCIQYSKNTFVEKYSETLLNRTEFQKNEEKMTKENMTKKLIRI